MVKKILTGLCVLLCSPFFASGQQTLASKDMIAVTPLLASQLELSVEAKRVLQQKLSQMVTQNGFGSNSGMFVLTANAVTTDKRVTASVPAKYIVEMEVSIYVVNALEQLIVDEMSFTVKGIESSENRAVVRAFTQINTRSSSVRRFMNGCREKITDYYNTRIPTLIGKAQSFARMQEYESALAILTSIPDHVDQYPVISDQMVEIYTLMLDRDGAESVQKANGFIALRDYQGAMNELVAISPASNYFSEASRIIEQIKRTIDDKEKAELERQMRIYEDQKEAARIAHADAVELERMRIEAAQSSAESGIGEVVLDWLGSWFLKAIF